MTVVKCDRCGKEAKNMDKYLIVCDKANPLAEIIDTDKKFDLCNQCANKFESMLDAFFGKE